MDSDSRFGCSICFEPVVEPVVTLCGHLFCWPCLYRWTQRYARPLGSSNITSSETPLCPVCKTTIPSDNVIPLYVVSRSGPPPRERKEDDCKTLAADATCTAESTSDSSLSTSARQSPRSDNSDSLDQDIPRRPSPIWSASVPDVPRAAQPPLSSTVGAAAAATGTSQTRSHFGSLSNSGPLNVIQLSFTASTGLSPSLFSLQFQPSNAAQLDQQSPCYVHEFMLRAAFGLGTALAISILLVS